jgi:hypothetical protein
MTGWNNEIEASAGEIVDKITILNIKLIKIKDEEKVMNIQYEFERLAENFVTMLNHLSIEQRKQLKSLKANLFAINLRLWNVEDSIREKGSLLFKGSNLHSEFIYSLAPSDMSTANSFMLLARDVYLINGERFSLKCKINELLKSPIVEEKSH